MVRLEFKHLKADEKAIAERFLDKNLLPGKYTYDIILDTPDINYPVHWTKKDIDTWSKLRAKRIDMLVTRFNEIWIIEVTPKVNKTAIGGCLSYRELYIRQYNPELPVKLGIVCEVDDLAYHHTLNRFNIKLWVV